MIVPLDGVYARRTQRAVVVLPQPDSPTSASVSPAPTSNETSSTARISPTCLRRNPRLMGKNFLRFLTSSSVAGSGMGGHGLVQKTADGLFAPHRQQCWF